jgi:hypothetical protein
LHDTCKLQWQCRAPQVRGLHNVEVRALSHGLFEGGEIYSLQRIHYLYATRASETFCSGVEVLSSTYGLIAPSV